jgi:hypothetical protein
MRTSNLAKLVSLPLLAVAFTSNSHAAYLTQAEARHETIFVPNCWPDCVGAERDAIKDFRELR